MWRVILGTFLGIYIAQTYKIPNLKEKLMEFDQYLKDNKYVEKRDDKKNN